jgi:hypothetical protein
MPADQDPTPAMTDEQHLAWLEALAEKTYDQMYDCTRSHDATALYSDTKEALYDAIGLARRLGQEATATRLEARLANIKAVFRSQFT